MMEEAKPEGLIETMRAEGRKIDLLDAHLERLRTSAEILDFVCSTETVRSAVQKELDALSDGVHRVRLVLNRRGKTDISIDLLGGTPFQSAIVYPYPLEEAGGLIAVHKTTKRAHYDKAQKWANDRGADEAILLNPRGQVFDATRSTVWVEENAMMYTPPLEAGGLPGVMRRHLLKTREDVREKVLRPNDLETAGAVYLSNAVRGLMLIQLI